MSFINFKNIIFILSTSETQINYGSKLKNRMPTEFGSYSGSDLVSDNLLSNSSSPIKSPPYVNPESDDIFKGTGNFNFKRAK